jgi:hypothetical protein
LDFGSSVGGSVGHSHSSSNGGQLTTRGEQATFRGSFTGIWHPGALMGLIYHELFSLDYRVAQGEVLIFFRSDSKQREPERVCRDYLLQPSTQQWAAISAMVGTIIWGILEQALVYQAMTS